VWDWTTHKLTQRIDLGEDGLIPLEVRFLHDPSESEGYVGCALGSSVFRIYKADVCRRLLLLMLLLLLLALKSVYTIKPVVKPVSTTGLTTGWTFVYTMQPVVQPAVQLNRRLSYRFDNWFDNRLYRVNGVLDFRCRLTDS